jgi:hypothetical protein
MIERAFGDSRHLKNLFYAGAMYPLAWICWSPTSIRRSRVFCIASNRLVNYTNELPKNINRIFLDLVVSSSNGKPLLHSLSYYDSIKRIFVVVG